MFLKVIGAFARRTVGDALGERQQRRDPDAHLRAAEAWLERAHDVSPDGGVSYGYSLRGGWKPSYRETSGYIATTFFNLAAYRQHAPYRQRALEIASWLVSVQNADGSFANPRYGPEGIVFDTGQALFGLVRAWRETEDERFLSAGLRAGRWLATVADAQGRWTRNEHFGTPHVYNSRTAWALLQLDRCRSEPGFEATARSNLDWAVAEQSGGYFRHCAFVPGRAAYTHTIAYTIRGLLESGRILQEPRYLQAARAGADAMLRHRRPDGFIPGQVDEQGREVGSYCCLTGNCQLSIIWAKIHEETGEPAYREAVLSALDYVMSCQDLDTGDVDRRGAIKGSQPIWGRYAPLSYPNWATKFFIDAMMLRARIAP